MLLLAVDGEIVTLQSAVSINKSDLQTASLVLVYGMLGLRRIRGARATTRVRAGRFARFRPSFFGSWSGNQSGIVQDRRKQEVFTGRFGVGVLRSFFGWAKMLFLLSYKWKNFKSGSTVFRNTRATLKTLIYSKSFAAVAVTFYLLIQFIIKS